jgi:hypothetical protein
MPTTGRVEPWLTLSVAQGKAVQVGGMLGAATLAWPAGRQGTGCARWMVLSRLLAYFSEHACSHWLVGRALGIRFTGMASTARATRGPTHRGRFVFSCLPFQSARLDPQSLGAAAPAARVAMYAAGTVGTVIPSLVLRCYCLRRGVPGGAASSSARTCGACRCS